MASDDSGCGGCLLIVLIICLFVVCNRVGNIKDRLDELTPPPVEETTDDDR